jgi:hypothetical protein
MLYFCKDCPFSIFQMLNLLNVIHCDYYSFFNARVLTYRAARWFVFKPKIPIGVNFGGPLIGKCVILNGHLEYFRHLGYFMTIWYILWPFGTFYDHLVHFMTIWYMLWPFGTFYDHLVHFMNIWYILWPFGTFYDHLVHFMTIWYILWTFGTFYEHLVHSLTIWYISWSFGTLFPVLVSCTKRNLATLLTYTFLCFNTC